MKIAVITPYHDESHAILTRCHRSVASQLGHHEILHVFVADGSPHPCVKTFENIEHFVLPANHGDAGATPRTIGAISVFSRGYDAVSFLDVDNTLQPNHVNEMAKAMESSGASVVTATRNICNKEGNVLYVDTSESNGSDFCDTNCMFIGKNALHLLSYWVTDPAMRLWSDRQFWSAIVESKLSRMHVSLPTVNYHSRWAWHYHNSGLVPPPDSVWIDRDSNGNLIHKKHSQI